MVITVECSKKKKTTEKDHAPQCTHQLECIDCGQWLIKHRSRFPLGPKKEHLCIDCFEAKWESMTQHLSIDWQYDESR